MLPLLLVLALCTGVVSSAPCLADGNGFNVASGSALTCNCGTTTCKNSQEGCDTTANKCVCPPGSAWGKVGTSDNYECIMCGPFTTDERNQEWYTPGYQCVGGSTTVVGDGKTICPAGTVDYRECDMPSSINLSGCTKKGTIACKLCRAGQYQDQEGTDIKISSMTVPTPIWYVFFFSPPLSLSLSHQSLTHSHNLI